MNATIYVLENPSLLANMFAGQIPAVAFFFGITHLLLRKRFNIKIRPWLALAYVVAPALVLALLGWELRAEKYGDGIKILVPLVLSALSCGALYYQEWRHKRNGMPPSVTVKTEPQVSSALPQLETSEPPTNSAAVQIEIAKPQLAEQPVPIASTQSQLETPEPQAESPADEMKIADRQLPEMPAPTISKVEPSGWRGFGVSVFSVSLVASIFLLFILYVRGSGPNYVVEDGGDYGYKETKKGATSQSVKLFRYAGIHNGKHQVYVISDRGHIDVALECAVPCKAIKQMLYMNFEYFDNKPRRQGMFVSKSFIPADSDSVEARVMGDAVKGHLNAQPLNPAALKFYQVQIEAGMQGVPIRPVFAEDWISFEYMGEAETPPKAADSNEEKNKSPVTENLSKPDSRSKHSNAVPPASTSTRAGANSSKQLNGKEEVEIKKLTLAHPDWLEIVKSSDFQFWRDNVISDGKALMESEDAEYISRRLSQFKKWRKEQGR